MNTLHLKYTVEVEKTGSITKAADRLRINQPNLSKTIRELEETFGAEIFRRTSKGMVPTRKGVEFLACARNVLTQLEQMENLFVDKNSRRIYFSVSVPRASVLMSAQHPLAQGPAAGTGRSRYTSGAASLKSLKEYP
ncbi:MAG: LysR family transcriptional regulator [Desulfovibrio sp.]|jgi:DNA-binding transcriptional LysR family regulator|nr:LysR family transcriptional regulator [Desulfovibrio sp.]